MVTFNFPAWAFSLYFCRESSEIGGRRQHGVPVPSMVGPERGGISSNKLFQGQRSYPKCNRAMEAGEAEGAMQKRSIKRLWQVLYCGRHVNEQCSPTFAGHFLTLK